MRGRGNGVKGDGTRETNQDKLCAKRGEARRRGDEARGARPVGKARRHGRGKGGGAEGGRTNREPRSVNIWTGSMTGRTQNPLATGYFHEQ